MYITYPRATSGHRGIPHWHNAGRLRSPACAAAQRWLVRLSSGASIDIVSQQIVPDDVLRRPPCLLLRWLHVKVVHLFAGRLARCRRLLGCRYSRTQRTQGAPSEAAANTLERKSKSLGMSTSKPSRVGFVEGPRAGGGSAQLWPRPAALASRRSVRARPARRARTRRNSFALCSAREVEGLSKLTLDSHLII